jgi:hypothetical protein
MLTGPVMGLWLFHMGGYSLPFQVTGVFLGLLLIPAYFYIQNDNNFKDLFKEVKEKKQDTNGTTIST